MKYNLDKVRKEEPEHVYDVSADDRGSGDRVGWCDLADCKMKPQWIAARTSRLLVERNCPPRKQDTHKGNYGRLLLICGAEGYTGAPFLAASAALRTGAGLIYTAVPRSVYPIVAAKLHAPMVLPLADRDGKICKEARKDIFRLLDSADACLLGPGLGRSEELDELVAQIVRRCRCPLVLDADGINAVAGHIDVVREAACPIVLTPHEGEFRRLTDREEPDRISGTAALAKELGAVVLRKGHVSVISDGERTYVNQNGNAGMATGGSGDVLAGVVTALLGQGVLPLEAAATAAWLHGTAGDLAARKLGQYAMAPTDVIGQLSRLLP